MAHLAHSEGTVPFGKFPENSADKTYDQQQFLEQAVSGLAQEGKVISVRLALFAEMLKGKAWTPATLKKVGGTEGVGVTFLEETFSAATAPLEHRYHQKAGRAVVKALLPESGTDIKGTMRSYAELLEASGYGNRPKDFDGLVRILDREIRLITPTDPEPAAPPSSPRLASRLSTPVQNRSRKPQQIRQQPRISRKPSRCSTARSSHSDVAPQALSIRTATGRPSCKERSFCSSSCHFRFSRSHEVTDTTCRLSADVW